MSSRAMANDLGTPTTPRAEGQKSESRLESLPMDLLVEIICHLSYDIKLLTDVTHVSPTLEQAVLLARKFHFNYLTPLESPIPRRGRTRSRRNRNSVLTRSLVIRQSRLDFMKEYIVNCSLGLHETDRIPPKGSRRTPRHT